MYVGELTTKQLISIALMILFALAAMFFLGYKHAYTKAINYVNEQIEKEVKNFKINQDLISGNPDVALGNMQFPDIPIPEGGQDEK